MSWDPVYSFGTPNAQPPTPTKTPVIAAFPSPAFHTPKNNQSSFDTRTGWTPTFAEEYSVFNATPGRLTVHHSFSETPRPAVESRRLASTGDLAEQIASHVHHISSGPPPAVDPSNQLLSSTGVDESRSLFDDTTTVTPQKPKKNLDQAYSGQTATPPHSASKGSRKLAPKLSTKKMHYDSQDGPFSQNGTADQPNFMQYPQTSSDMFGYPLSAPATAPVFGAKPFWDNDTSMSGLGMEFAPENQLYNTSTHRSASSFDWGRSNQIFQENINIPPSQEAQQPVKRQRALAPKAPALITSQSGSHAPFHASLTATSIDSFVATSLGGVDPGLLFSRPSSSTTNASQNTGIEDVILPLTRPSTSQVMLEPYQHQLRESRRDQEELRRARSTHENGSFRFDKARGTASSPVRGSARPVLQRSISDSKGKRIQARRHVLSSSGLSRTDDRPSSRAGRSSPAKQSRFTNLVSIPESPDHRPRTEVKFTIDANGKARTETVLVSNEPKRRKHGPFAVNGESWASSSYDSSSDDEPIIITSQNNSFALPSQRNVSILSRIEGSNSIPDGRRSSASGSSYNRSDSSRDQSSLLDCHDSEAETVMDDDDDGSGDATRELRKVMESRKQQLEPRNTRHHRYALDARGSAHHTGYGSSATSPTDFGGATPCSTRGGPTRCVCNKADSDGFMIQCESCDNWLHGQCIGIDQRSLPPVYICAFCANTPNNLRGTRRTSRGTSNLIASPLAHKSLRSFR
ncbi:PHD-finger domain-containing protein [Phlyctema vagabunda]|uniref:PHD-finger domain-containing protein n=1 Tax=Phlyctema vagabunda TaxID=108571 RepID=A0ABR4PYA1_9HELO